MKPGLILLSLLTLNALTATVAAQVTPSTAPAPTNAALAAEVEPELLSLYTYKPIYFLVGSPYTKIQLSFETQIVKDVPVYFGYSQVMLWDLFLQSPYFYDINFNPLAWYRFSINGKKQEWLDFIPLEHESNGKGGLEERSWDRTAVAFHRVDELGDSMKLYEDFKVWVPLDYNVNNRDLAQYRGVWELNLTLSGLLGSFFKFNDLALRLYPGGPSYTDPLRGGQELTFRFRAHRRFLPLAVLQVFHGYGEYLQDYRKDQWDIRAGVGF